MAWVPTYCGIKFDLLNPDPRLIRALDIEVMLSTKVRWNGATKVPITVAQHSVLVARDSKRPKALLHDAAEIYIGDITAPLRHLLPAVEAIERRIMRAIEIRFELEEGELEHPEVLYSDMRIRSAEWRDLGNPLIEPEYCPAAPSDFAISQMTWGTSRRLFAENFQKYFGWVPSSWDALAIERDERELVMPGERL